MSAVTPPNDVRIEASRSQVRQGRRWRGVVDADPFTGELVVEEQDPGAEWDLAVAQAAAHSVDALRDIGQGEVDVGVAPAGAAADVTAQAGGLEHGVESILDRGLVGELRVLEAPLA